MMSAQWREFMRQRGLKGGEETPDVQQALKARKLLAEVEERELRLAVKRGEFIPVEQVRADVDESRRPGDGVAAAEI